MTFCVKHPVVLYIHIYIYIRKGLSIIHADSSSRAVCGRSPAEIVGSNPAGYLDVCLLWVLCVVR